MITALKKLYIRYFIDEWDGHFHDLGRDVNVAAEESFEASAGFLEDDLDRYIPGWRGLPEVDLFADMNGNDKAWRAFQGYIAQEKYFI